MTNVDMLFFRLEQCINKRLIIFLQNRHFFAPHNIDYGVLRFQTLSDPSVPSQIKELLSPNDLQLFKKTRFGYLLLIPKICAKPSYSSSNEV